MEEKKQKRVLTIELDDNVKKVSITGLGDDNQVVMAQELNEEELEAKHMRFHMIFNERVAIIYNFSKRYFAGATLVMNNSVYDNDAGIINQNKWRARAIIGMRL